MSVDTTSRRPSGSRLGTAATPPAWLAGGATSASELIQALGRRLVPAPAALMGMTVGYQLTSRAITAAAELGVADALAAGPLTVSALARETSTDEQALNRLLRLLQAAGLVRLSEGGRVSLTRLGAPLRSDHPQSVRDWCRYLGADWHWELWAELDDSVRDGRTAYERRLDCDFFSWFAERPAQAQAFDDAMTSFSALVDGPVAAVCDLRGARSVVDVAGGSGALLAAVMRRNTRLHGALFDRPDVVARAGRPGSPLKAEGLAERASFLPGDIFESAPAGYDAYMLKWILHDWPDEQAGSILRCIADAAPPGARLFTIEMLIEPGRRANPATQLDLAMLTLTGGRERTREELQNMMHDAGFEPGRVRRTASPMHVVEATRR